MFYVYVVGDCSGFFIYGEGFDFCDLGGTTDLRDARKCKTKAEANRLARVYKERQPHVTITILKAC